MEILIKLFLAMVLNSVLLDLMDFSDMVILRSRPKIVVANKTLSGLVCLYYIVRFVS